jgi:DNA polymerase III subunit gamma/tau
MENYIVSARKYRPETFENVIGQPSITTTLRNAIRVRQLAHAYLFCGPRGVGKTTCARIFAKTINCFNLTGSVEACNQCESCLAFNSSRSYNIHELDAASNNSVEDIRNLIDQVRIPPQVGKYSVYIIDEVHMLSPNAFNAFLKTLEEPPSHAIFILATTEKYKIIPTILSRCQVFDFNRIKIEDIVSHLEEIARNEKIEAEGEGLNIIARKADGAMRDALSMFDLIASFSSGTVTYNNVIENLNILDYDYFFKITDAILSGDISSALLIFDEVLRKGFDSHNFINGLSSHFRDLLVCRDEATLVLLEVGQATRERYRMQSGSCKPEMLLSSLALTNQCDLSYRSSKNQRLHVELCLVQLCGQTAGEKKKPDTGTVRVVTASQPPRDRKEPGKASIPTPKSPERSGQSPEAPQKVEEQGNGTTLPEPESAGQDPEIKPREPENAWQIPEAPQKVEEQGNGTTLPEPESAGQDPEIKPREPETAPHQEPPSSGQDREIKPREPETDPQQEPARAGPGRSPGENGQAYSSQNTGNTFSIKNALRGIVAKQEEADEVPSGNGDDEIPVLSEESEEFTEKDLIDHWRKFANQLREGQPRLCNTLLANKPEIVDQATIRFEVTNPLQEEALNKIRPELLSHLKRELNASLELEICINETLQENRLYLPEDKYEHMLRKNPELARLRHRFNLDFD